VHVTEFHFWACETLLRGLVYRLPQKVYRYPLKKTFDGTMPRLCTQDQGQGQLDSKAKASGCKANGKRLALSPRPIITAYRYNHHTIMWVSGQNIQWTKAIRYQESGFTPAANQLRSRRRTRWKNPARWWWYSWTRFATTCLVVRPPWRKAGRLTGWHKSVGCPDGSPSGSTRTGGSEIAPIRNFRK